MASDRRQERVNLLLQEQLADILNKEILFPNGTLVTITRITTSPDLYYGDIFISVFPKKEKEVLELLKAKTPFIQQELNRALAMRPIPRIQFKIDEEEKSRERIEKLLANKENSG